jgi:predicted adenine nucleotide alpha hydrolase (AANH) superfamily ATPase
MEAVLLHSCCAPCSAPIVEWMQENGFSPTLFFFNPNIYPAGEEERRKEECFRFARQLGVRIIDGGYEHDRWLQQVAGHEDEPERGRRCLECFRVRMEAAARLARELNVPRFTTTLTGSRWKSYTQIVEAAGRATASVENVRFWDRDWKKGGLSERRRILLEEHRFYNQSYCGCEFSIRRNTK